MAPKNISMKKIQIKKKKNTNKAIKKVSKHNIQVDDNINDDSDGSLDAIEFNSE